MVKLLVKKFVQDYENVKNAKVRQQYGALCGVMGIILNILLFLAKCTVGVISGSVSIVADAINNLSDAGSSLIMFVGFRMAGRKPDPEHPFGHGRIEYVTGLIVSMLIVLMGVELAKNSIAKIISPKNPVVTPVVLAILGISILVKLYMYYYNKKISEKLESAAMRATAMDSLSDSAATGVVFIAMLVCYYTGVRVDGWCGLLTSGLIMYTGITSTKDTLDPLLGSKPSREYVETIEKFVTSYDGILGIHDLIVHDYGPGRMMISLHAEVPADANIVDIHDTIDIIENRLNETLGCQSVIHMDPIVINDEENDRMRRLCDLIAKSVDESFTTHDFRMVKGNTHTNLIFDVVAPFDVPLTEEEIAKVIRSKIESLPGNHFAVIHVDRPFV